MQSKTKPAALPTGAAIQPTSRKVQGMNTTTNQAAVCPPALATVPDVARVLALSRSKVYQLMDAGLLPYVKLGRCRRIHWADVEELIAQNRVGHS